MRIGSTEWGMRLERATAVRFVVLVVAQLVFGWLAHRHFHGGDDFISFAAAATAAVALLRGVRGRGLTIGLALTFVDALAVEIAWGSGPVIATAMAAIDVAEVAVGLGLTAMLAEQELDRSVASFLWSFAAIGVAMPLFGATLGGTVLSGLGVKPFGAVWPEWFLGELIGAAVVLPVAASVRRDAVVELLTGRRRPEFALVLAVWAVSLFGCIAFFRQPTVMLVLPMVVAAFRLGRLGTAATGALVVVSAFVATDQGVMTVLGPVLRSGLVFTPWAVASVLLPYCIALIFDELKSERERIATRERYFRDSMHQSPLGMALLDPTGRCLSANRALADLLGMEPEELVGKTPADISHPEDAPSTMPRLARLVAGEIDQYALEKRFVRKDGRPVWVFLAVAAVRDAGSGRAVHMVAQIHDIEARRRTEKALEESESRWNFALESAGQGVWDYDYRRRDTFYSPMWSRMLGYEPHEISTESDGWLTLVHPHDLPRLLHHEQQHLRGDSEQFECEFRMRHKDGRWLWILDRGKVIARDDAGRPLRMIGTHTDVTEYRRLTDALQEEKERLRITLHSIGDGVIATDSGGFVTFMNPIAEALTGWSAACVLGRPVETVFRLEKEAGEAAANVVRRCLAELTRVPAEEGVVLVAQNGTRLDVEASASPVRKAQGELIGTVLVFQDVTRSRTLQKELAQLATHDALTGLQNRSAFEHGLTELCAASVGHEREHALGFLDLDRFKIINDTAGHAAGDALLREVGRIVREHMRRSDVVARLGGDEFGILMVDCPLEEAEKIGERLIERIGRVRFAWGGRIYEVGASMGLARIDAETPLAVDVMSRADVACYAAKAAGRNRVSVYHPSEGDARQHHAELHTAAGIRAALEGDRFVVFAQEILDLRPSGHLQRHAELLVRMVGEDGRLLMPGSFIPAAERYGLMAAIDRWMIRQVLHRYDRAILAVPRLVVSINLSANSLEDPGLLSFLAEALDRSALPPHRIRFEITETSLINNIGTAGHLVEGLRSAGYAIMLDDFGAGVSSFSYLERFPADYIKIDGSFVRKLQVNAIDRAIVESINDIGHKIGAITVAEFVEDAETLTALQEIGVDMAQGFHIARPMPLGDFLDAAEEQGLRSATGP